VGRTLSSKTNDANLFHTNEEQYGEKFGDHLLEQYKLYVEMADRVSARRALANTFFLTANTALLATLTLYGGSSSLENGLLGTTVIVVMSCGLVAFSASWWLVLRSYDQLNTGKFRVIHELEQRLPAAIYDREWDLLGRGSDPKRYRPLTRVERIVPLVFIVLYLVAVAARFLAPRAFN
jgi:Zn-dependent protease with chaperone function